MATSCPTWTTFSSHACEGLVCTVSNPNEVMLRLELVHTTARQFFDRKLAEWAPGVNLDLTRTCLKSDDI